MSRPPLPHPPAPMQGGYGNLAGRSSSPMAQFLSAPLGQGSQASVNLEWMENGGVGLMQRQVIPPAGFQPSQPPFAQAAHLPQFPYVDGTQGVIEDFSASMQGNGQGAMNSGTYFTDMITANLGRPAQPENAPPPQDVEAQDEVQMAGKGVQRRSKNFSIEEDEQLVRAWLNVSLDPVRGVDQSRTTYWKRIHAYFHANKDFESDRSSGSLLNRWSGIQHDVNLFAGCLSKIECRNQSGVTIDDKQADALKLFIREDKQHRQFPYMHCWKILKGTAKWANRQQQMETQKPNSKKRKTSVNSSPTSVPPLLPAAPVDENQQSNSALLRPSGQKKEKQKLRQQSSIEALDYLLAKKKEADAEKELKKEERCNKAFALQEERIRLEKEKLKLQRDQFEFNKKLEEERIMKVDTSHMCPDLHQHYEGLKNEIRARRLNN